MAWGPHDGGSYFNDTALFAYYKFENNVTESTSGLGSTAPAAAYTSGVYGGAGLYLLSATTGGAVRYAGTTMASTDSWTCAAWVNVATAPTTGLLFGIIRCTEGSGNTFFGMYYDEYGTGATFRVRCYRYVGSNYYSADIPGKLTKNRWYHLVSTYDGTSVRGYSDGCLIATTSAPGTTAVTVVSGYTVGGSPSDWPYTYTQCNYVIEGKMDEAIIAKRAWTQAEVGQYYARNCQQYGTVHP